MTADSPRDKNALTLDQSMMLPFVLPTSMDMLISYGAGIGGVDRERARKYVPTIPTEILAGLELGGSGGPGGEELRTKERTGTETTVGSVGSVGGTVGAW